MDGDLTIKGITHPVRATGTGTAPLEDPFGGVPPRAGAGGHASTVACTGWSGTCRSPRAASRSRNDVRLLVNLEFTQA